MPENRTSILLKSAKIDAADTNYPKYAPTSPYFELPWAREVDIAVYVEEIATNGATSLSFGARIEHGIADTSGPHMSTPFFAPFQNEQLAKRVVEGVGFYGPGQSPPATGGDYGVLATQSTVAPFLVSRTIRLGQPLIRLGWSFAATGGTNPYVRVTVLAHGRA